MSLWLIEETLLALLEGDVDEVEPVGLPGNTALAVSCGEQQILLSDAPDVSTDRLM